MRRAPMVCGAVPAPAIALVAGAGQHPTSPADLALPLAAAVAAVAVAASTAVRRRLRATRRTTPGGGLPGLPTLVSLDELDRRATRSLVATDDCVRTSREELGHAERHLGHEAVQAQAAAVESAATELGLAFEARQRLDGGEGKARELLEEIVARCEAAGRRLDAEAAGFDLMRALEQTTREALERTEARFREVAARVAEADGTLAGLRERFALSARLPVAGHDEQAKDRLIFAMTCLNRSRQAMDRAETGNAVVLLRAAEAAVDQAALFQDGIARLASDLSRATAELPAALDSAEADLAAARALLGTATVRADLRGRVAHGESVLAAVRGEPAGAAGAEDAQGTGSAGARDVGGRYDPVGALRRIEQATAGLDRASHRAPEGSRALGRLQRALVVARSIVGAASDRVTTQRGAVGREARTRLAEAERLLRRAENTDAPPVPAPAEALVYACAADTLARQAGQLAERDVRVHGTPYGEGLWTGGAVLGGILLDAPHRRGDRTGHPGDGGPASYGGPGTRGRRDGGGLFRPVRPQHPPGTAPPVTGSPEADPPGTGPASRGSAGPPPGP
ncbi:TPM domain-containing protein [Streptomyces nodosus]|uniref:TPM domain-containing protein n=1 Tax=Streptomyces nodosus TaxID=40318 RepID=UPI0037F6E822